MATIKSFTNLEQSMILADILPLLSADMCYINNKAQLGFLYEEYHKFGDTILQDYYPCWSQTALYNILPVVIGNLLEKNALRLRIDKGETDFNVWYDNLDTGCAEEGLDVGESNPVDAYYEMIIKLHEQNLI